MKIEDFLQPEQEQRIAQAIAAAEKRTSGEIKVHLDLKCPANALDTAKKLFKSMKMHQTRQRNGVLIYIAIEDRKMAIFGDEGIHTCVGGEFWQQEIDLITPYFKRGEFEQGLLAVIEQIGEKLRDNFPYEAEKDTNELPNEITYGKPS
ncbi:MAG: putative membrane protein [Bacteroidetes bacterium HLUCCA01]|nr:MAG: putative membrane protein [Bacteroidetes bacterium HLUCCA01]